MKRWLETHRLRKAARMAMQRLREVRSLRYHHLAFNFDPWHLPILLILPVQLGHPREALPPAYCPVLDYFAAMRRGPQPLLRV
jgi:hypothetical protein